MRSPDKEGGAPQGFGILSHNHSAKDGVMKSIRFELKYCEGCGTLKLRPVTSSSNDCRVCERLLARFRFPRARLAANCGGPGSAPVLQIPAGIPLSDCASAPVGRLS